MSPERAGPSKHRWLFRGSFPAAAELPGRIRGWDRDFFPAAAQRTATPPRRQMFPRQQPSCFGVQQQAAAARPDGAWESRASPRAEARRSRGAPRGHPAHARLGRSPAFAPRISRRSVPIRSRGLRGGGVLSLWAPLGCKGAAMRASVSKAEQLQRNLLLSNVSHEQ